MGECVRCTWCNPKNPRYVEYHDREWCRPRFDDAYLYEMLILESFQAGLSWECVLNKRESFRAAYDGFDLDTGRKKVGAMVGDGVEIGCGAVLCPGTVVGRGSTVYPLVRVRGVIPEEHIVKSECATVPRK